MSEATCKTCPYSMPEEATPTSGWFGGDLARLCHRHPETRRVPSSHWCGEHPERVADAERDAMLRYMRKGP